MATNTANIDAVAQAVQDGKFTKRTRPTYVDILTDAQDFLSDELECLVKIDSTSVVLVGGTREYTMPTDFVKFSNRDRETYRGWTQLGTNGKFPLKPATTNYLDHQFSGWRGTSAGVPEYFYINDDNGTLKIGFQPTPSTSFVTDEGSTCRMKFVYRAPAIADNTNRPFNNLRHLENLNYLLKLHAIWQINLEDKSFIEAEKFERQINARLQIARDQIESSLVITGFAGFEESFT